MKDTSKINDFVLENNNPIGLHGGTSVGADLVKPGDNQLHAEHIEEANKALDKSTQSSWNGWQKDGKTKFVNREE
jgi:hypothetical protein